MDEKRAHIRIYYFLNGVETWVERSRIGVGMCQFLKESGHMPRALLQLYSRSTHLGLL